MRQLKVAFLLFFLILVSCAPRDASKLYGHWRAERYKLEGVRLPMGPDFHISQSELVSFDGHVRIPISSIDVDGPEYTINIPAGVGLAFKFEGDDRISFALPFTGDKVLFERIKIVSNTAAAAKSNESPTNSAPVLATSTGSASGIMRDVSVKNRSEIQQQLPNVARAEIDHAIVAIRDQRFADAEYILRDAQAKYGKFAEFDYHLAVSSSRQNNIDGAIRHLSEAFTHGFRSFSLLENSDEFAAIRSDVRYGALIARYK